MENQQEQNIEKHPLESIIGQRAKFITNDGRVFVGILKGLDQALNCIITEAEQRVYSLEKGVVVHPLGTYFIRGDTIVALGEFVQTQQEFQALAETKAKVLTL